MVNHFQSVKYIFSTDLKRFKTHIYSQLEDFNLVILKIQVERCPTGEISIRLFNLIKSLNKFTIRKKKKIKKIY